MQKDTTWGFNVFQCNTREVPEVQSLENEETWREYHGTLWGQMSSVFLWMGVFGFGLGLSAFLCERTCWIQGTTLWRFSLQFLLPFVAADVGELQAGRDGAGCFLNPRCGPTHETVQHGTRVSWDNSSLLHGEVALVIHKCHSTQSPRTKT